MNVRAIIGAVLLATVAAASAQAQDPAEIAFWESVKDSKNPEELQAYIDGYPAGRFLPLARIRLKALQGGQAAPATPINPAAPLTVKPVGPARPPVGLGAPPPVSSGGLSADKPVYAPFEPIVLSWSGIKGSYGAIGIGAPGEVALKQQTTVQFSTKPNGNQEFDGALPGKYEARIVAGDKVEARIAFEVREAPADAAAKGQFAPRIVAAKPAFKAFENITVTWSDIRAPNGWVALFDEGGGKSIESKSVTFFNRWAPSGNLVTGSQSFRGLLPGKYEARVLAGEYGKEFVLARTPVLVQDDAEPAKPAGPVVAGVPAPGGAAAPGGTIDLAGATLSSIGGVVLIERAKPSNDPGLRELMSDIMAQRFNVACSAAEIFTWRLGPQDQARLERVTATSHQALRVRGYTLKKLDMDDTKDWLAFEAAHGNKRLADAELLVTWHIEENDLHLMLCRKAPPGDPPLQEKPQ